MNNLFHVLPSAKRELDTDRMLAIVSFTNHEQCEHYWDEKAWLELSATEEGEDCNNRRLLRTKFMIFTDIRYLEAFPENHCLMDGDKEAREELLGKAAYAMTGNTPSRVVNIHGVDVPRSVAHWVDGKQVKPIVLQPVLCSCTDVNDWMAESRCPQRVFRAHKHGNKEKTWNGNTVSPLTLTSEEANEALRHAVGNRGENRLVYYSKTHGKIYVFPFDNTLDTEGNMVYHGYQIDETDNSEISSLPSSLKFKLNQLLGRTKFK